MSLVVFCFGLGVEDGIRNMNMSEPVPQLNPPRTMMPNVAYRPPAGGPSVPVVRPQAASPMRPPDAAAAWRGMAQAYPASSSTPTFYSATHGDSDDDSFDASSMMSAVSYLVLFTLVAFHFCRAMLCKHGLCRHAVSVCLLPGFMSSG